MSIIKLPDWPCSDCKGVGDECTDCKKIKKWTRRFNRLSRLDDIISTITCFFLGHPVVLVYADPKWPLNGVNFKQGEVPHIKGCKKPVFYGYSCTRCRKCFFIGEKPKRFVIEMPKFDIEED